MAKIESDDFERYEKMFENFANPAAVQSICKQALYDGAGAAAAQIYSTIQAYPVQKDAKDGMTKKERAALLKGFGLSRMEEKNGDLNLKIGFSGYNELMKTKLWPKGVPIPLTARSLMKGTSWRKKDNFMQKAQKNLDKTVAEAIEKKLDEELEKIGGK